MIRFFALALTVQGLIGCATQLDTVLNSSVQTVGERDSFQAIAHKSHYSWLGVATSYEKRADKTERETFVGMCAGRPADIAFDRALFNQSAVDSGIKTNVETNAADTNADLDAKLDAEATDLILEAAKTLSKRTTASEIVEMFLNHFCYQTVNGVDDVVIAQQFSDFVSKVVPEVVDQANQAERNNLLAAAVATKDPGVVKALFEQETARERTNQLRIQTNHDLQMRVLQVRQVELEKQLLDARNAAISLGKRKEPLDLTAPDI
ncbi:hypothetical protein [Pyruvatibacter mobilis]|uniref:hypothetical protein n=1 Tax=Pyruvatibacter mobilis TaxID=1712261 RepID=UPI003BAB1881